jgi:hypothetical protein
MYSFVTMPKAIKLIRMLSPNSASLFIDSLLVDIVV